MFSSVWKIIVVLSTLTIFQLPNCDAELKAYSENGPISALFQTQGFRNHMEDRFIRDENSFGTGIGVYAVFDGHSGDDSSNFTRKHFTDTLSKELMLYSSNRCSYVERRNGNVNFERMLNDLIAQAEVELENEILNKKSHKSGTTCLIAIAEKSRLTVANVGDSRGVMCAANGQAIDLSIDHKPDSESEKIRIENAGGKIYFSGVWRVNKLAMSRSLGDNNKKGNNVIIATPDIRIFNLDSNQPKFIILATDGLWDVMSSQAAVDFIEARYLNQQDFGAKELATQALKLGSTDNITILIVVFKNGHYEVGSSSV